MKVREIVWYIARKSDGESRVNLGKSYSITFETSEEVRTALEGYVKEFKTFGVRYVISRETHRTFRSDTGEFLGAEHITEVVDHFVMEVGA